MTRLSLLLLLTISATIQCIAQQKSKDSLKVFKDDRPINVVMKTDIRKLIYSKNKPAYQSAQLSFTFPDSTTVGDKIRIKTRGVFRRETCHIPSLKLNFRHSGGDDSLYALNELKMVCPCETGEVYDQYLLKEYLIYKMYNLLTKKSFKVRLLNLTIEDSANKKKPLVQHAFLIENIERLADRNKCKEFTKNLNQENTDREQMTLVAIFQYMIGNTDWAVGNFHNVKLVAPKKDPTHKPYVIPYDFDFAGLVNANYATPNPASDTKTVTERWYMGFARTQEELNPAIKLFIDQHQNILSLIDNCEPLSSQNKKEMKAYIEEFYNQINDERFVKRTFVDYARSN